MKKKITYNKPIIICGHCGKTIKLDWEVIDWLIELRKEAKHEHSKM